MQSPLLPSRKVFRSAVLACLLLLGTACGLKAPLYLPDEKAQEVKRGDAKKLPSSKRAPTSTDPGQTQATPPAETTAPPATDPDSPATTPPPAGT